MSKGKDHPIIFNSWSVQRILAGAKTQTRRVIKPIPPEFPHKYDGLHGPDAYGDWWFCKNGDPLGPWKCPYGHIGDHLYVRETCWLRIYTAGVDDCEGSGQIPPTGRLVVYCANENLSDFTDYPELYRKTSSIFMPRAASRINLEILDIRVERIQDISDYDCKAEGAEPEVIYPGTSRESIWEPSYCTPTQSSYYKPFIALWDSINARRGFGWDKNPWVWAISFKLLSVNQGVA